MLTFYVWVFFVRARVMTLGPHLTWLRTFERNDPCFNGMSHAVERLLNISE